MKYIFLTLISIQFGCSSFYQTKTLAYSTRTSAFYRIDKNEFANRELLDAAFKHPYKIESSKIEEIIGNLRFRKTTRIGELRDYIFHQQELSTLSKDLNQVLENIKPKEVIETISMYDHSQSVISNYKRTTFLMWIDDAGLNILFGQIQSEVTKDISRNFLDWSQTPRILLQTQPDENDIEEEKEPSYVFKKINGFYNKKWLIFSLKDLTRYKLKERRFTSSSKKDE